MSGASASEPAGEGEGLFVRWIGGPDPMPFFRAGRGLFRAGRVPDAIEQFRLFLLHYRQSPLGPAPDRPADNRPLEAFFPATARLAPYSIESAVYLVKWMLAHGLQQAGATSLQAMQSLPTATLTIEQLNQSMWRILDEATKAMSTTVSVDGVLSVNVAYPWRVAERLWHSSEAAKSDPDFLLLLYRARAHAGRLEAVDIAEQLRRSCSATPAVLEVLRNEAFQICDVAAVCRFARDLEMYRLEERRAAARRGSLMVLFEDYLWSFGDTGFRFDMIFRLRRLGWIDWFPLVIDAVPEHNPRGLCNSVLIALWEQYFPVVYDRPLLEAMTKAADTVQRHIGEFFFVPGDRCVTNQDAELEMLGAEDAAGKGPTIILPDTDRAWGMDVLAGHGMPRDGWFACFHVREHGWHGDAALSDKQAKVADPETFVDAMRAVVAAGGTAIRFGDPSMRILPDVPGVIDIAHSPHKSPRLDIFLCGAARFFVCTCSGPLSISQSFGVPLVMTNMAPPDYGGMRATDLFLPKLVRGANGSFVPFAEIQRAPFRDLRYLNRFRERGYDLVDNTADEVAAAVNEMIALVDGGSPFSSEDAARQERFRAASRDEVRPQGVCGRPSAYFLRKHADLL